MTKAEVRGTMTTAMTFDAGQIGKIGPKGPSRSVAPGRPDSPERIASPEAADKVAGSQEIRAAMQIVQAAPEIRADKVAQLAAKIRSGEFKIDPDLIAERIIKGA